MNVFKRYIFLVLLCLGIWCIIWVSTSGHLSFIRANGPSFILQSFVLFGLIYYAVPELLFKNRLLIFLLFTVIIIVLSAYGATNLSPPPIERPGSIRLGRSPPPFLASLFSRQLLIMSITCLSAVIVETFTLAQQKQKSEALVRAELKESELKFLKMQINPHFLFNALNNIYALSVTHSQKTQEGISTLSLMLRYVLYDCELPKVPLRKELEYITSFIELFKLKSSEEYNINFIEEVEGGEFMIAPMLFVPFIENSLKHSGIEKRGNSFVNIKLVAKGHMVEFSVENSLPSAPLITDSKGGIGLQNVKKRLDILYPQTHHLDITKTNTFHVKLKVDLE